MKKVAGAIALVALMLTGCGETEEEKRFRAQLIEKAVNDDTRKQGDAFLAENAKKEGVQVTESGLQYKVLKAGQGVSPKFLDTVLVHYEGKRVDGVEFDSSYKRGKPSEFPVRRVIKGWREALVKMKVGDVWQLYVPADLAYGSTSPNELIPANSALVFKVELLEVKPPVED